MVQIEMIPAEEPSVPDKEHLHHGIVLVLRQRQHVLVLTVAVGDLLLLGHCPDAGKQFPVFDGLLKFQRIRRILHFLLQHLQHRLIVAA